MTEQQRQPRLTSSSDGGIKSSQDSVNEAVAVRQRSIADRENEHEANLKDLQHYICELLIKNQRLRWSLEAATNHQRGGIADDHK